MCYHEIFHFWNGPEVSKAPFIYRCPARAAVLVAQAGQCQRGWANLKAPSLACSLQNSISQRAQKVWLDSKTVRGLSAWWGPRWKMKGSFNAPTSIPHDRFKGESKVGGLPLFGQGLGGG
ncbi:MAG TPA: hypothetical protein VIJ93_03970 [bacterium]